MKKLLAMTLLAGSMCLGGAAFADDMPAPAPSGDAAKPADGAGDAAKKPSKGKHKKGKKADKKTEGATPAPETK